MSQRSAQTEARPRIMEALEMVGLDKFAESYPRELSGGHQRRRNRHTD